MCKVSPQGKGKLPFKVCGKVSGTWTFQETEHGTEGMGTQNVSSG